MHLEAAAEAEPEDEEDTRLLGEEINHQVTNKNTVNITKPSGTTPLDAEVLEQSWRPNF